MDVGDFMGGIVFNMEVWAFAIKCLGWRHRKACAVQLCGHRHGCAAASSIWWVGKSHWLDVWGLLGGIVHDMGSVVVVWVGYWHCQFA